jgi:putative membrane protein
MFLGPSRLIPPCRYPIRILGAFMLMAAHMPILGLLALSENPLYPTYEYAPRIIPNFSAMDDQVLGGSMMEMVAALVSVGLLGWSIWGWMKDDDRRNAERVRRDKGPPTQADS